MFEGKLIHCSKNANLKIDANFKFHHNIYIKMSGIWFSFDGEWIDWLEGYVGYVYEFIIDKNDFATIDKKDNTKILVIDTEEEINEFIKQYVSDDFFSCLNKEKLSKDYGGLAFKNYEKSKCWKVFYNALDCSSGCIWNYDIIKDIRLLCHM